MHYLKTRRPFRIRRSTLLYIASTASIIVGSFFVGVAAFLCRVLIL